MRRFAAVLSSFLFAVILATPSLPAGTACPAPSPVPLRGLYFKSDLVVVGKIGKPGKWKTLPRTPGENDNYQRYLRLIPVQVEESIKGVAPRNLTIQENQSQWIDAPQEQKPQTPQIPGAVKAPNEPEFYSSLAENTERRLFFLNADTDGESHFFEVYSGRRLEPSQQDLPVYISRLRELHAIYTSPSPSKPMIVEWLVAMAEDPITRFEGAYELRQALYRSGEEEEEESDELETAENTGAPNGDAGNSENTGEAKEAKENIAGKPAAAKTDGAGEPVDTVTLEAYEALSTSSALYPALGQDYSDIVKLLTPNQKERLIQAFLDTRFTYREVEKTASDESEGEDAEESEEEGPSAIEYEDVLSESDDLLLNTVGELKDRRVIDRLIAELPSVNKYGPREAYGMIGIITAYYDDEKLESLADKYSDVYWGDDNELIEDEAAAHDLPAAETSDDVRTEEAADEAKAIKKARDEAYVPSVSYGRRRADLLAQVLARCAELGVKKGN
jgi:hypothetical protein